MMQLHDRKLGLLCALIMSWFLATNYTLNHFYVNGAAMLDSGWFAYLSVSTSNFSPPNPPSLGGTYFSTHFSPIFYLISAPHRLLTSAGFNIPDAVWFSIVQGFWPALMTSSIFILIERNVSQPTQSAASIGLAATLLTFNGATLASVGFPHFEMAIPALLAAFFACYCNGKFKLAILFLFVGLLVREDAGLHYFGLFFILASYLYAIKYSRYAKQFLFLAFICAVMSLLAISIQKYFFGTGDNALVRVYLGNPAFAHLSLSFLIDRIIGVGISRLYLFAPMLMILILAFRGRNWALLIGVAAILPWVVLNISAVSVHAGFLSVHYSFPFAIMVVWPAILCGLQTYQVIPDSALSQVTIRTLLLIAISSIGFAWQAHGFSKPHAATDFFPKWIGKISPSHTSLQNFMMENEGLKLIVDDAVASLTSATTTKSQWKFMLSFQEDELKRADAIVYQPNAWLADRVQELAPSTDFQYACYLPNTHFRVRSKSSALKACVYVEPTGHPSKDSIN